MPLDHWKPVHLTPKHKQALVLIAQGATAKELADKMGISLSTAEKHRDMVKFRYDANNTTLAVVRALKSGDLKLDEV